MKCECGSDWDSDGVCLNHKMDGVKMESRKHELLKPHQVEVKGESPVTMLALAKYNEALSIGYDVGQTDAEEQLQKFRIMCEWARQHYNLPQDLLDVMGRLAPQSIAFNRIGFLKEVFGEDYTEEDNEN